MVLLFAEQEFETGKCGFTKFATAELVTFHSPQYPNPYPKNMYCDWLLLSSERNRPVELIIEDLNVEECCDNLEVSEYTLLFKWQ